jgi:hypothetical protein
MPWKRDAMSPHFHHHSHALQLANDELATLGAVVDRALLAERDALDRAADALTASLVTAWPEIPPAAVWRIACEQLTEAALNVHREVTKYPYPGLS